MTDSITQLNTDYTTIARPTQLLADLIYTFWDTRKGLLPSPEVVEVPIEEASRIDMSDENDYLLVLMDDYIDEPIHIGFANRDIKVPMRIMMKVSSNRRRMYEYFGEIKRIIETNQHDPAVYLLEGFENYGKDERKLTSWLGRSSTEGSHLKYTNFLLQDTGGISTNPTFLRASSNTAFPILRFQYELPNFQNEDDFGNLYYDFMPRVKYLSFYARQSCDTNRTLRIFLRGANNQTKHYYEFSISNEWKKYSMNITDYIQDITYTDPDNVYVMDFHLFGGYDIDLDYLVLGSCDFQFLNFGGHFREVPNTFNYWEGEIRCEFREYGRPRNSFLI